MASLIAHALLGILVVWWIVRSNPGIFRRTPSGPLLSTLELGLYVVGIASVVLGWYFNVRFVQEKGPDKVFFNPIWGDGSWTQYIKLMFANPAASSAGQDYTIGNVILLPLMTIVDGRRRGIHRPWLYFASTLFTSFAFGWAFYLATVERQRRLGQQAAVSLETAGGIELRSRHAGTVRSSDDRGAGAGGQLHLRRHEQPG